MKIQYPQHIIELERHFSPGSIGLKVLFSKLNPDAVTPSYSKEGDAGLDMHADSDFSICPGCTVTVPTGICMAIEPGYFGSARERSSMAFKGIRLGGGVIDSGYRGEIKGILTNLGQYPYQGAKGDRIFQILFQPVVQPEFVEMGLLPESQRGATGFGSTGS